MSLDEVPPVDSTQIHSDIILNSATLIWPRDDSAAIAANGTRSIIATPKNTFTLADMNLRFPAGELSLICGKLGIIGFFESAQPN